MGVQDRSGWVRVHLDPLRAGAAFLDNLTSVTWSVRYMRNGQSARVPLVAAEQWHHVSPFELTAGAGTLRALLAAAVLVDRE